MSGGLWPTPPDLFGPNYALVSDFLDKLKGLSAQSASAIAARAPDPSDWLSSADHSASVRTARYAAELARRGRFIAAAVMDGRVSRGTR